MGPQAHVFRINRKTGVHHPRRIDAARGGAGLRDALGLAGGVDRRTQKAFTNRFRDARGVEAAQRQQLRGIAMIDELVREAQL